MLKVHHQLIKGGPVHLDIFLQRLALVGDPVDPAMQVIPRGVPDVVLHVPDDDIVPVGHIECTVGTEFHVRGAEVLVGTLDEVLAGVTPHVILVVLGLEVILLHPEEADGIGENVIALPFVREVPAGNHPGGSHRPHFLFHEAVHLEALALGTNLVGAAPGSIVGVVAAPVIEAAPVRVRAVTRMHGHRVLTRIEAEHGGGPTVKGWAPRMLMGVMEEDPALPVEGSIGSHREGIGCMVGISGADPL